MNTDYIKMKKIKIINIHQYFTSTLNSKLLHQPDYWSYFKLTTYTHLEIYKLCSIKLFTIIEISTILKFYQLLNFELFMLLFWLHSFKIYILLHSIFVLIKLGTVPLFLHLIRKVYMFSLPKSKFNYMFIFSIMKRWF